MAGFFDIPEKDNEKGLTEILNLIEGFAEDPNSSKLNQSFGTSEPTAVLKAGEFETEEPTETNTQVLPSGKSFSTKGVLIKLFILIAAILLSLAIVDFITGL